ncbi:MAG: leucine-rich repeat protein [Lachnospiraceae bacterium]|nr:leucine-rich repeat protein [Lachnospiraceae bacterium]
MKQNKKVKKCLLVFLALALVVTSIPVSEFRVYAAERTDQDYQYQIVGEGGAETIEITGYLGNDTILEIPESIDGKKVTAIGKEAFSGCSGLKSISIPDSVTAIGERAFYRCRALRSISIPDGVTAIGEWAFYRCYTLKSISIPDSVTEIGENAFGGCWGLEQMTVESGNAVYDSRNGCNAIIETGENRLISGCKNTVIPGSVTTIGIRAFCGCERLKSISIPDSVTAIERAAFSGSKLESISIPDSVTAIGQSAFYGCIVLESINIPDSITEIMPQAFFNCYALKSISIPNSVTAIGVQAFYNCCALESISIPDSVTVIEQSAFSDCIVLESISIPDSVTAIKMNTFYNCCALESISIPDSVTAISDKAFYGCSGLKSISIPDSVTVISDAAFYGCSGLKSISIPDSVMGIGSTAFSGCSGLEQIVVGDGNTAYDSRNSCNAIIATGKNKLISGCKNTVIPDSVTAIERAAFFGCSGLKSISIPDSVTKISNDAFSGCSGLEQMMVENGNTVYDSRNGCNAIIETGSNSLISGCKNTVIPDSITKIESNAFYNCDTLKSISIPDSVTEMDGAFYGCSGLEQITVGNGNTVYDSRNGCNAIIETGSNSLIYGCKNTVIPDSVTKIRSKAFYNCDTLKSINIPDSVTAIGESAFSGCSGLKSISIPDSVTEIGEWAFSGCRGLEQMTVENGNTVYDSRNGCHAIIRTNSNSLIYGCKNTVIPDSVTQIRSNAFYNCDTLKSISIPDSVTLIESGAFYGCGIQTVYCNPGSYAESYALSNNIPYQLIISEKDISGCKVLLSADGKTYQEELPENTYTADGKAKMPDVHLAWVIQSDGSYEPIDSSYYEVTYENNVNVGTATVRITGKSPYTGSLTKTFPIGQGKTGDDSGLSRYTYSFGNTEEDFGYAPGYKIDEESIFTKLWGNTALAQQNYEFWTKKVGEWKGNCYGMSATSIMFNDNRDDIEISGFNPGAAFVKELELNDYNRNSNIRMSLLDLIEVMQVSQTDETIAKIIGTTNRGRINWMCSALQSAEEEHTAVIIVLDSSAPEGQGPGAHALVGYHMEDISETERRIYVYDCNHPGESRYITLVMENGACTSWYYDGGSKNKELFWTSEKTGDISCTISYISYDSFVKVWLNRSLEEKPDPGRNVMTLNVANASICDKTGQEVAVLKDGEIYSEDEEIFSYYPVCARLDGTCGKSEIQPMIYLPTGEYTVKNTDEGKNELQMSMCNVDRKLSVVTSAASLTVNVSDISKVNVIQVEGEGEKVEADFYSSDASEQYKSMNYIGSVIGSSLMTLGSSGGEKVIENFEVTSETEESKDPEEKPDDKEDDPGDKKEDTDNKQDDTGGKKEEPDNKNDNSGSKNDSPANKNDTPADNVSFKLVSSTGSNKIAAGKKVKLTVVTTPQNAAKQKLSYSSSNKKAATVSSTGTVSVKKNAGGKTVVITAVNQAGRKASLKIKIMKGAVKKIQVTGKNSCKAGKSLKLKAKVTAGKGANKSIVWKSSNTRYAEVTKTGTVKTKKKGKGKKVKITAAAADGSGKKGSVTVLIK